jgi:hypothetical protein
MAVSFAHYLLLAGARMLGLADGRRTVRSVAAIRECFNGLWLAAAVIFSPRDLSARCILRSSRGKPCLL